MSNQEPLGFQMTGEPLIFPLPPPKRIKFESTDTLHFYAVGVYKLVERRAYEIFEKNGRIHGNDWLDWLIAERDIFLPLPIEYQWFGDTYVVTADVPGFRAEDISIARGKNYLIISGERQQGGSNPIYTERQATQIYRTVNLPEGLDLELLRTDLNNGQLDIKLPRKSGWPQLF